MVSDLKILTLTGTRPELIRLSVILTKLDKLCNHIHVYSNQNYDAALSTVFFEELRLRKPNYYFTKADGLGDFLSNGYQQFNKILDIESPDRILVLGDTNSGLLSVLAAKRGIPIYHMEAGNRCYDDRVPEELNRRIIDTSSTINLPYTENSKQNLLREGYHKNQVFKTGNPIQEVLMQYEKDIDGSNVLYRMNIAPNEYSLLTLHRAENIENRIELSNIVSAINKISEYMKVVCPIHPHTKSKLKEYNLSFSRGVKTISPLGFFDFCKLEKYARVVFTDSGTIPEETSILGRPCIVLRNSTERQELLENGGVLLAGTRRDDIVRAFGSILEMEQSWQVPDEYSKKNVSETVLRILLGRKEKGGWM